MPDFISPSRRSPYEVLAEDYRDRYPDAEIGAYSWTAPEGVEVLARVQIRQGDPYFWIVRPLPGGGPIETSRTGD